SRSTSDHGLLRTAGPRWDLSSISWHAIRRTGGLPTRPVLKRCSAPAGCGSFSKPPMRFGYVSRIPALRRHLGSKRNITPLLAKGGSPLAASQFHEDAGRGREGLPPFRTEL